MIEEPKMENYINLQTVVYGASILEERFKISNDGEMLKLRPYPNSDHKRWKYALIAASLGYNGALASTKEY